MIVGLAREPSCLVVTVVVSIENFGVDLFNQKIILEMPVVLYREFVFHSAIEEQTKREVPVFVNRFPHTGMAKSDDQFDILAFGKLVFLHSITNLDGIEHIAMVISPRIRRGS